MASTDESAPVRGALIFLHGTGDSGAGMRGWLNCVSPSFLAQLEAAGIRVFFPSAPIRPYTLAGGRPTAIWHDRTALAGDSDEDIAGLAETAEAITGLIAKIQAEGVERRSIVLGGFSQGGGVSIYCALARHSLGHGLAGVFSLGSWVTTKSAMWTKIGKACGEPARHIPPVFMGHGAGDGLIDHAWGVETRDRLRAAGVDVSWLLEDGVGHEPGFQSLAALRAWILKSVPPRGV